MSCPKIRSLVIIKGFWHPLVVVSQRIKQPVDETPDSHWSTVKVNSALTRNSITSYVFRVWWLIKYRGKYL
jgi:hypothetical protein